MPRMSALGKPHGGEATLRERQLWAKRVDLQPQGLQDSNVSVRYINLVACGNRRGWRAEADEKENYTYAIALHND